MIQVPQIPLSFEIPKIEIVSLERLESNKVWKIRVKIFPCKRIWPSLFPIFQFCILNCSLISSLSNSKNCVITKPIDLLILLRVWNEITFLLLFAFICEGNELYRGCSYFNLSAWYITEITKTMRKNDSLRDSNNSSEKDAQFVLIRYFRILL